MTVLYFGIYDPMYARNWVLIHGLRQNGVEVLECRVRAQRGALIKLFFKFLFFHPKFDAIIIGFPGQEVMFLARWLTRKPIIFDAFTSHYEGYILDYGRWGKESFRARYFKFLDRWSCRLASLVLLDTQAHIDFFVQEFGLSPQKFKRLWIGANSDMFHP